MIIYYYDNNLKKLIVILKSYSKPNIKLSLNIFSIIMVKAGKNNYINAVLYCLSNKGSVNRNMINNITNSFLFKTHKSLVE